MVGGHPFWTRACALACVFAVCSQMLSLDIVITFWPLRSKATANAICRGIADARVVAGEVQLARLRSGVEGLSLATCIHALLGVLVLAWLLRECASASIGTLPACVANGGRGIALNGDESQSPHTEFHLATLQKMVVLPLPVLSTHCGFQLAFCQILGTPSCNLYVLGA